MTTGQHTRALREWRTRWADLIRTQRTTVLQMSQSQLARYLGVHQSTVAGWESGNGVPHDLMKVRVIALMGLDARVVFAPLDSDPPIRQDLR